MASIFQIVGVLCFLGAALNLPGQSVVWMKREDGKSTFVAASGWRDGKAVLQTVDNTKQSFPGKVPSELSLLAFASNDKPAPRLLQAGVEGDKLLIADESGMLLEELMGDAEFGDPTCQLPEFGGIASNKNTLVCTFPRRNALWFIDLTTNKITSKQSLPDFPTPTGVAYDAQGRLWALSGNTLAEIQFTSDGHFNPIHHRGDFDHPHHLLITTDGKFYIADGGGEHPMIKVLNAKLEIEKTIPLPEKFEVCALVADDQQEVWMISREGKVSRIPK